MQAHEIIAVLQRHEGALRARGVSHAALFGSTARGTARPESDIDIMVEFDPASDLSVFEYVGLKDYVAGLFPGPVDVVDRAALKSFVRPPAESEAIYAF